MVSLTLKRRSGRPQPESAKELSDPAPESQACMATCHDTQHASFLRSTCEVRRLQLCLLLTRGA
jgi:hypothetical protein